MKNFNKNDIERLLSNLCCSKCKNDFTKDSITVKSVQNDIYICNLSCKKCGKDFGDVVFGYNKISKRHPAMQVIEGPEPISFDDVIDAHNYIKHHM